MGIAETCSLYCANRIHHSQPRLNFSVPYWQVIPEAAYRAALPVLWGCALEWQCYCNIVGHALMALLMQLKILPQNKQAEISTQFVCQQMSVLHISCCFTVLANASSAGKDLCMCPVLFHRLMSMLFFCI